MFENIISLGQNCLVASALAKHGLRSTSGPFDWCTSNFMQGVIPLIENDFADFMDYKNLAISHIDKAFDDTKYKINYSHDVKTSLDEDYDLIREKYARRIDRFRKMIKSPTCFIRGCRSMEELTSLPGNEERIRKALYVAEGSELIFVVPKHIFDQNPIETGFRLFTVDTNINGFDLGRDESRSFFDTNDELIEFLVNNYPVEKRKDNLIFDLKAELAITKKANKDRIIDELKEEIVKSNDKNVALSTRLALWMRIENTDYSDLEYPENIAIYGCGAIGRILSQKINGHGRISEFIDREPRQKEYQGIPVNRIEDSINKGSDSTIIVVPTYDFEKIEENLKKNLGNHIKVVRVQEWLSKARVIDPNF